MIALMCVGLLLSWQPSVAQASEGGQVTTTGKISFVDSGKGSGGLVPGGNNSSQSNKPNVWLGRLPQLSELAKNPLTWVGCSVLGIGLVLLVKKNRKKEATV